MIEINVLILSAGRRVELIQCFKKAAHKLNIKSNIIAADCSDTAPALYFSDKSVKLPRIDDKNYINCIISVCNQENIALIVPTIDTDLLLLSENKEKIEEKSKAKVLISNPQVIRICRNKIWTQKFLEDNNFGVPKMYTDSELENQDLNYPLFIKPKSGSSSINVFKVSNKNELELYRRIICEPIVQDYIEGEEYTVDVLVDFEGNVMTVVPRLRIATRGGEISKGKIIKDREIIDDVIRLIKTLKPIGHVTVQLMKTKEGIKYIEINPRFGGGAPMSIQSGADSCENIYRILMGQELSYNENYRENIIFLRFDSSICIDENWKIVRW